MSKLNKKYQKLDVEVKNNRLIISIGVDTLAFAANCSDYFKQARVKKSNQESFAKEVVNFMIKENEVGESLLTRFLDKCFERAVGSGAESITYKDEV